MVNSVTEVTEGCILEVDFNNIILLVIVITTHYQVSLSLPIIISTVVLNPIPGGTERSPPHQYHIPIIIIIIIKVVLNTAPLGDEEVEIRPHSLSIHSYKTPTFCRFKPSPQKCLLLWHFFLLLQLHELEKKK